MNYAENAISLIQNWKDWLGTRQLYPSVSSKVAAAGGRYSFFGGGGGGGGGYWQFGYCPKLPWGHCGGGGAVR